jgi:hypothetical protein
MKHEPRYAEVFGIFWTVFRNGIVHGSFPQPVTSEANPTEVFSVGVSSAGTEHLCASSLVPCDNLTISADVFLDDLQRAFDDKFRDWLLNHSDDGVLERAAPRLLKIRRGDSTRNGELARIRQWNAERTRAERVRERAYFLWENRMGSAWWDAVSNWLEAERIERTAG